MKILFFSNSCIATSIQSPKNFKNGNRTSIKISQNIIKFWKSSKSIMLSNRCRVCLITRTKELTSGSWPMFRLKSWMWEDTSCARFSTSATTPAPQQLKCIKAQYNIFQKYLISLKSPISTKRILSIHPKTTNGLTLEGSFDDCVHLPPHLEHKIISNHMIYHFSHNLKEIVLI